MTVDNLDVLRQFRYDSSEKQFLTVENQNSQRCLSIKTRDDLPYISCLGSTTANLSSVCEVATVALRSRSPWFGGPINASLRDGMLALQARVSHYWLRHQTTPEMVEFVKTVDDMLYPEPFFVTRVLRAIVSFVWPFGGASLISSSTASSFAKYATLRFGAHDVVEKQRGTVALSSLPTMDSLKSGIIPQKRAILEKALGGKADSPTDSIEYVRFVKSKSDLLDMAAGISAKPIGIRSIKGSFDYRSKSGYFNCVVNFGDPGLFRFWETLCFAQDEIQVMEHPDLGRLQKYLSGWFTSPWTETFTGTATPWLIKGVKRHCEVDTGSMYGWKLAKLSPDQVKRNISRIRNPTTSNILVMTAPSLSNHSQGQRYSSTEILKLFYAAYTAFKGAKQEAQRLGQPLSVQTGNWGSGAFGNDATLMAVIQILAFRFAGGDHLDYFTYDSAGQAAFNRAQKFIKSLDNLQLSGATPTLGSVLRIVYQADFLHGKSNGT